MHSLSYLATLYFWTNFIVCKSYDISIQVRFNLIMLHAHSPYTGLADLYTHAVNACYVSHVIITHNHTLVYKCSEEVPV